MHKLTLAEEMSGDLVNEISTAQVATRNIMRKLENIDDPSLQESLRILKRAGDTAYIKALHVADLGKTEPFPPMDEGKEIKGDVILCEESKTGGATYVKIGANKNITLRVEMEYEKGLFRELVASLDHTGAVFVGVNQVVPENDACYSVAKMALPSLKEKE